MYRYVVSNCKFWECSLKWSYFWLYNVNQYLLYIKLPILNFVNLLQVKTCLLFAKCQTNLDIRIIDKYAIILILYKQTTLSDVRNQGLGLRARNVFEHTQEVGFPVFFSVLLLVSPASVVSGSRALALLHLRLHLPPALAPSRSRRRATAPSPRAVWAAWSCGAVCRWRWWSRLNSPTSRDRTHCRWHCTCQLADRSRCSLGGLWRHQAALAAGAVAAVALQWPQARRTLQQGYCHHYRCSRHCPIPWRRCCCSAPARRTSAGYIVCTYPSTETLGICCPEW